MAEAFQQPRTSVGPDLIGFSGGNTKGSGGFFIRQAGEVAPFNQLGGQSVGPGQAIQRFAQGDQLIGRPRRSQIETIQVMPLQRAAVAKTLFATGALDEDAPHGLGCGGEEVSAAVSLLDLLRVHEAQVRLVDQGGGLQRLARFLLGQLRRRQLAQLVVDQR